MGFQTGGIAPGGFNFDAKLRRESFEIEDLFYAHISSMDAMARGLRNAAQMAEEGTIDRMIEERYSSYTAGIGKLISNAEASNRSRHSSLATILSSLYRLDSRSLRHTHSVVTILWRM